MSEENLYTFENEAYRKTYWHTCSHVMAQAVKRLYPQVKLAIGPSIDSGWYYDFDADFSFTQEHLMAFDAGNVQRRGRNAQCLGQRTEQSVFRRSYAGLILCDAEVGGFGRKACGDA